MKLHTLGGVGYGFGLRGENQYGATLAIWFAMGSSDISSVFPTLHNFATRDLGFLV